MEESEEDSLNQLHNTTVFKDEREMQPEPENEVDTNRGIWRQNVGEHEMEGEGKDSSGSLFYCQTHSG